jgi:hypothetical protein
VNSKIVIRYLVFFLLVLNFSFLSYSQVSIQLDQTSFPAGSIDITGTGSSGHEMDFYVNDNFAGEFDLIASEITELLTNEIQNYRVPLGTKLVLINNNPDTIYTLSSIGVLDETIEFQEEYEFISYELGDYTITNLETGVSKTITVFDEPVSFTFSDVEQSYFNDGSNKLGFKFKNLQTRNVITTINETITYDKFSNTITVDDFKNTTTATSIRLTGRISDTSDDLYYVLNINGIIGNTGLLQEVEVENGKFNETIRNLGEGENTIRFITTQAGIPNIFTGEEIVKVISDNSDPNFEITNYFFTTNNDRNPKKVFKEGDLILTNSNTLSLNISTDADLVNFTFNGIEDSFNSEEIINNNYALNLVEINTNFRGKNDHYVVISETGKQYIVWDEKSGFPLKLYKAINLNGLFIKPPAGASVSLVIYIMYRKKETR